MHNHYIHNAKHVRVHPQKIVNFLKVALISTVTFSLAVKRRPYKFMQLISLKLMSSIIGMLAEST